MYETTIISNRARLIFNRYIKPYAVILFLVSWIVVVLRAPYPQRWKSVIGEQKIGSIMLPPNFEVFATPDELGWRLPGAAQMRTGTSASIIRFSPESWQVIAEKHWQDISKAQAREEIHEFLAASPREALLLIRISPYLIDRLGSELIQQLQQYGLSPLQENTEVLLMIGQQGIPVDGALTRGASRHHLLINSTRSGYIRWLFWQWIAPFLFAPLLWLALSLILVRSGSGLHAAFKTQALAFLAVNCLVICGQPFIPWALLILIALISWFIIESYLFESLNAKNWGAALRIFAITRFAIILITFFGAAWFGVLSHQQQWRIFGHNLLLDPLARWDSEYFLSIAIHGYAYNPQTDGDASDFPNSQYRSNNAFFPLYPLLIRAVTPLMPGWTTLRSAAYAGILISNLFFLMSLAALYKLIEQDANERIALRSVWYLALFPMSFFFSAVYTESVFLFLCIMAFNYSRNHRFLLAGVFGGLAAFTRLVGIALVFVFVTHAYTWFKERTATEETEESTGSWLHRRISQIRSNKQEFFRIITRHLLPASLLTVAGLGVFCFILWHETGDPIGFYTSQQLFGNLGEQHMEQPWASIPEAYNRFRYSHFGNELYNLRNTVDFLFTGVFLLLTIPVWRKFGLGVALFHLTSLLLPSIAMLRSLPRYCAVLFPAFHVCADWGENETIDHLIRLLFSVFLALAAIIFATWRFIA